MARRLSSTRALSTANTNRKRKQEHLRITLNEDVQFKGMSTGLEEYQFIHQALPQTNLDEVDLSTSLLGKRLNAPLVISGMVGGIERAAAINRNLARAAQALGVAMGVGSQRCAIDDETCASTYQVRTVAPDILLFANLGAIQLNNGYGIDECRRAVAMIEADALVLHLNPLQEALQPGGNSNFADLLARIEEVCHDLPVPVIVKEVGGGISDAVARKLASVGVAGIDVSGAGGTSWSEVEKHRARSHSRQNIAAAFATWGIPTAESILMVRRGAPNLSIIASGGIRNGLDAAKAIALGAHAVGLAAPLLNAADNSAKSVVNTLAEVIEALRIAMFCIGASSLAELKDSPLMKRKSI